MDALNGEREPVLAQTMIDESLVNILNHADMVLPGDYRKSCMFMRAKKLIQEMPTCRSLEVHNSTFTCKTKPVYNPGGSGGWSWIDWKTPRLSPLAYCKQRTAQLFGYGCDCQFLLSLIYWVPYTIWHPVILMS
jgi:hypothetical protein